MVEKLEKDMIEAMKAKDMFRLTVIRMVKGALKQEQIDHKKEINDELLIDVVNKQIKMRKDSITEFEKGNRQDLVDKTQAEIDILLAYLPEQLSTEEVATCPEISATFWLVASNIPVRLEMIPSTSRSLIQFVILSHNQLNGCPPFTGGRVLRPP